MAKLEIGQIMPDFEYVTPFSADHTLAETAAAAPKTAVTCPHCGASTIPDENGRCEYCGGSVV